MTDDEEVKVLMDVGRTMEGCDLVRGSWWRKNLEREEEE